jgi:hypothetical protein
MRNGSAGILLRTGSLVLGGFWGLWWQPCLVLVYLYGQLCDVYKVQHGAIFKLVYLPHGSLRCACRGALTDEPQKGFCLNMSISIVSGTAGKV